MHQGQTNRDEIGFIDREDLNRHEADIALGREDGAVPLKMVAPPIASCVEEADDISSLGMPAGNVRAFMPVAVETRQREVVCVGCAAVLAGDDVVDVEWQRVSRGRKLAVFAPAPGTLPNLPRQVGMHDYRWRRASRAFDWITASRFPTCR